MSALISAAYARTRAVAPHAARVRSVQLRNGSSTALGAQLQLPFYIGGEARAPNHDLPVTDKYTHELYAKVLE